MKITIVRRPQGEAPEWVRDAWIGLTLPLLTPEPYDGPGFGVLSAPTSWLGQTWARLTGRAGRWQGWVVGSADAVERLAVHAPAAAAWWRDNVPWTLDEHQALVFDHEACESLPESAADR